MPNVTPGRGKIGQSLAYLMPGPGELEPRSPSQASPCHLNVKPVGFREASRGEASARSGILCNDELIPRLRGTAILRFLTL